MPTTWNFARGLLGFPGVNSPTFASFPDTELYGTLDAGDGISFVLAQPGAFFPDYTVELPDPVADELVLSDADDASVWVLVTQCGPESYSVNLRGPVVVNRRTGAAAQVVLDDTHPTNAPLGV